MRTVQIVAETFIKGVPVKIGQIVDVDESDASLLFEGRKAMEWKQGLPLPEKTVAEESAGDSIPDSKATKKK